VTVTVVCILDAGPMIAYLNGESGAPVVAALLSDANTVCYAHAVNMAEVYYHFLRIADEPTADQALADLAADGVIVREDMDVAFWKSIAKLKARGRISIADCFCIALASRLGGEVVTTDHHEFDPLVPLGIVAIHFIR
jgi:PIN domain nuclease of toxin-antitoxin system